MENSRRAGNVVAPVRSTWASTLPRIPTSRSVVVSRISPSLACSNTFDKIGSVVRVLTTFWTVESPSSNLSLLTLNFMVERYQSCAGNKAPLLVWANFRQRDVGYRIESLKHG